MINFTEAYEIIERKCSFRRVVKINIILGFVPIGVFASKNVKSVFIRKLLCFPSERKFNGLNRKHLKHDKNGEWDSKESNTLIEDGLIFILRILFVSQALFEFD